MRLFEILVLLADAALISWAVATMGRGAQRPRAPWLPFVFFVPVLAVAAQVTIEGYRWQMVPAYGLAALAPVLGLVSLRRRAAEPVRQTRARRISVATWRVGLSLSLTFAVALPALLPVPRLPEPAGPYAVGTVSYAWVDPDRPEKVTGDPSDRRELAVQAWYPAAPKPGSEPAPYVEYAGDVGPALAEGFGLPPFVFGHLGLVRTHSVAGAPVSGAEDRWPVVIFSPGLGGMRWLYTAMIEDLASRGYTVVAVDPTYESAATVFPGGRVVPAGVRWPEDSGAADRKVTRLVSVRAADARFVLDRLEKLADGPLAGRLDLGRVGMLGHSVGGATTAETLRLDARFEAGVNIDGYLYGKAFQTGFRQPYLLVEGERPSRGEGYTREYVGRRDTLFQNLDGRGEKAKVEGAYHGNFSDGPFLSPLPRWLGWGVGPADPELAIKTTSDRVDTFLDERFGGR